MTVAVSYIDLDAEGYGRMGREIFFAMQRMGVEVTDDLFDGSADTVLFCKIPTMAKSWLEGQRRTILTMFETTVWPVAFRDLHEFETVFVPCHANKQAVDEWHDNVHVVPLGIDDRWEYRKPKVDGRFRIFTSGSQYRKGLDLACEAFKKAFPHNNDVELVLKTPHGFQTMYGNQIPLPSDNRFTRVQGVLSAEDEVELYKSANIYFGMSRGEGFGMMPLQAIIQGTPTIISAGHGHAMFSKYASTVDTTLVPATSYDMYGEAGDWWEPSVDDAVDKLRDMYNNYDKWVRKTRTYAKKAKLEFTWENTATKLLNLIGDHGPYEGPRTVQYPDFHEVQIQVTQPIRADIGLIHVDFTPGNDYWVLPHVKQALRDAGFINDRVWNTTVWRHMVERR
jgi:hypothetical protein